MIILLPLTLGFALFLAPILGVVWLLRFVLRGTALSIGLSALLLRAVLPTLVPAQAQRLVCAGGLWLMCCLFGPPLLWCLPLLWGNAEAVLVVGAIGALFTTAAVVPTIIVGRRWLRARAYR